MVEHCTAKVHVPQGPAAEQATWMKLVVGHIGSQQMKVVRFGDKGCSWMEMKPLVLGLHVL